MIDVTGERDYYDFLVEYKIIKYLIYLTKK